MRTGGCLCGAVRYRTSLDPARTVVCHCRFCQRLSGSAFAIWSTYLGKDVEVEGATQSYQHRSDESGRWIKLNFCGRCGTAVTSTYEKGPGEISILGGTFDDARWIAVDRHVWTHSRQDWIVLPPDVPAFEKSSTA